MSEKLDLDDLLLAIRTGKADAVFVHDTVVAMWKRIESLESRASHAGGAVAWSYECRQPFTEDPVRWAECFSRKKPDDNKEWIRNVTPLYTHPAPPASKEPVADEREAELRGSSIKETWSHGAGAYARCSYCGRYSDNPQSLSKDNFPCDCGKLHGWSGSFKKPTAESKWSEAYLMPRAAAPAKPEGV